MNETTKKILSIMASVGTAEFASITTCTSVKIPLKWGLGKNVTKVVTKGVQLNYNYESAVNRHYDKEGIESEFVAESLPWGTWLMPNKVITHKDNYYVRVYDYDNNVKSSDYYVDNRLATADEVNIIKEWLKSKKTTSRQECENKVRPTAVAFDNIIKFTAHGQTYVKGE